MTKDSVDTYQHSQVQILARLMLTPDLYYKYRPAFEFGLFTGVYYDVFVAIETLLLSGQATDNYSVAKAMSGNLNSNMDIVFEIDKQLDHLMKVDGHIALCLNMVKLNRLSSLVHATEQKIRTGKTDEDPIAVLINNLVELQEPDSSTAVSYTHLSLPTIVSG